MSDVHRNPPLVDLNRAYLADQDERRDEREETIGAVTAALRSGVTPAGRRVQRNLVPPRPQAAS